MNDKEKYDWFWSQAIEEMDVRATRVKLLLNKLLNALFIPVDDGERFCMVDATRLKIFGIAEEPINWGDLKCVEVTNIGQDQYQAIIEECAPDQCPTLSAYLERYMAAAGWNVTIKTEW